MRQHWFEFFPPFPVHFEKMGNIAKHTCDTSSGTSEQEQNGTLQIIILCGGKKLP